MYTKAPRPFERVPSLEANASAVITTATGARPPRYHACCSHRTAAACDAPNPSVRDRAALPPYWAAAPRDHK